MAARYWLSALAACGAISVSLAQSAEAAPQGFKDIADNTFTTFAQELSSEEVLVSQKGHIYHRASSIGDTPIPASIL